MNSTSIQNCILFFLRIFLKKSLHKNSARSKEIVGYKISIDSRNFLMGIPLGKVTVAAFENFCQKIIWDKFWKKLPKSIHNSGKRMFDVFCVMITYFYFAQFSPINSKKMAHTYLVIKNLLQWVGLGNLDMYFCRWAYWRHLS